MLHGQVSSGDHAGQKQRPRLDPVRNDRMAGAAQPGYSLDPDPRRSGADDLCPHAVQAIGQVYELRLGSRVFQNCRPAGQRCRHDNIFRGADAGEVEIDPRSLQTAGDPLNTAVGDRKLRSHGRKTFQVQVNRPCADGTAARQGKPDHLFPGKQRP